jgi:hypothetical protein
VNDFWAGRNISMTGRFVHGACNDKVVVCLPHRKRKAFLNASSSISEKENPENDDHAKTQRLFRPQVSGKSEFRRPTGQAIWKIASEEGIWLIINVICEHFLRKRSFLRMVAGLRVPGD